MALDSALRVVGCVSHAPQHATCAWSFLVELPLTCGLTSPRPEWRTFLCVGFSPPTGRTFRTFRHPAPMCPANSDHNPYPDRSIDPCHRQGQSCIPGGNRRLVYRCSGSGRCRQGAPPQCGSGQARQSCDCWGCVAPQATKNGSNTCDRRWVCAG